jgi:hypothetical protein
LINSLKKSAEQPFAGDGGIQVTPNSPGDPFQALDDLMAAVEALCPTWPQRETFMNPGGMLL